MKPATHSTNMTESGELRKRGSGEPVEIKRKITGKPAGRAMHSTISMALVRERIGYAWRRGKLSDDLAKDYTGVPRKELERIAHEELFGHRKTGAA